MGIKLLPKDLPSLFSFQTSELGKLYCFPLRIKDEKRLHTKQSESLSDDEWVRVFISVSCNTEESLKDGQFKPDDNVLSDDDVAKLSQSELEEFSRQFADTALFLKKYKDDEDLKQRDDESNATYLRRIYNHHHSNLATSKLSKEIERSIAGSKLAFEALGQLKSLTSATRANDILSANTIKSIEKLKNQENAIMKNWQPITLSPSPQISAAQKTVFHLESLKDLMLVANEVQAEMRKDITGAIADSRNVSRWNLFIGGSVLVLTLLGLWLGYSTTQSNNEQMNKFMDRLNDNSSVIAKPLEALSSSMGDASENNAKLIKVIESLDAEIKLLREERKKQTALLKSALGSEKK